MVESIYPIQYRSTRLDMEIYKGILVPELLSAEFLPNWQFEVDTGAPSSVVRATVS